MKKYIFISIICSLLFILFSGCDEPVFYAVSTQVESPEPKIKGSPTNFAKINNGTNDIVYVATGNSVWTYYPLGESWEWRDTGFSLGRITYLAASNTDLFILTPNGIYCFDNITEAPSAPGHLKNPTHIPNTDYRFITMYSANNQVFAGAMSSTDYAIFHITSSTANKVAETNNGLLNGAACNGTNYYFSVKDQVSESGGGIYRGDSSSATLRFDDYSIPFMGIVSTGTEVYAITRSGTLYDADTLDSIISTGKFSNGVLSVVNAYDYTSQKWDGKPFLLVGRQDDLRYSVYSGFTYGYLEIELDADGSIKDGASFREPALSDPSTLLTNRGSHDTFRTTIGTYALKFIFQSNDTNKTIFASTHQNGVWSLKEQNDRNKNYPYWNTEH